MTREEIYNEISYCNQVEGAIINGYCCETLDNLLDRIIDDHEAQLKLASDVYSTDKMHMYQELKAKDEEIEREHNLNLVLLNAFANEEIKKKSKARSIVAMLFWLFAKNRRLHKTNKYFSQEAVTESYFCFQQAYKMLKDTE